MSGHTDGFPTFRFAMTCAAYNLEYRVVSKGLGNGRSNRSASLFRFTVSTETDAFLRCRGSVFTKVS